MNSAPSFQKSAGSLPDLDDCYVPPHIVSAMTDDDKDEQRVTEMPVIWFDGYDAWVSEEREDW